MKKTYFYFYCDDSGHLPATLPDNLLSGSIIISLAADESIDENAAFRSDALLIRNFISELYDLSHCYLSKVLVIFNEAFHSLLLIKYPEISEGIICDIDRNTIHFCERFSQSFPMRFSDVADDVSQLARNAEIDELDDGSIEYQLDRTLESISALEMCLRANMSAQFVELSGYASDEVNEFTEWLAIYLGAE